MKETDKNDSNSITEEVLLNYNNNKRLNKNEAKFLKEKDAILIRLKRNEKLREEFWQGRDPNDITETDLDDYKFDHKVVNNGNTKSLHVYLDIIMSKVIK